MKSVEIKEKAKSFLAVNKYHSAILYAAILTVFFNLIVISTLISVLLKWPWIWIYGGILILATYFLLAPLEISQTDYYMRSYNYKSSETFVMYEGYKPEYIGKAVLIRAIRSVSILLGFALLIFPGIMISLRTAYVYDILRVNPKIRVKDIFKESNRLVKNCEFEFGKLVFSFAGWLGLCIISFGIVAIYVSPYYRTVKSIFFRNCILKKDDNDKNYLLDLSTHLNELLSNEIAEMEKKIQQMEKEHITTLKNPNSTVSDERLRIRNEQARKAELALKAELEYKRELARKQSNTTFSQGVPPPQSPIPSVPKVTSDERIYMDEIGDIRGLISADSLVDEIELPQSATPQAVTGINTSDLEMRSDESIQDFRLRVEAMKRARDKKPITDAEREITNRYAQQEEELRRTMEEQEAIRLAKMDEQAREYEINEARINNATKGTAYDELFKAEKLDIQVVEDDDEPHLTVNGDSIIYSKGGTESVVVSKPSVQISNPKAGQQAVNAQTANSFSIPKTSPQAQPIPRTNSDNAGSIKGNGTASTVTTGSLGAVKLTREELIEKLKAERERKLNSQNANNNKKD